MLSYVVSNRAPEIAVRMALGAEAQRVQRMVVLQGARITGAGVIVNEYVPESPMYRVFTMEALADRTMARLSFTMLMVGDVHRIKRRQSIAMIPVDIHALAN